MLHRLRQRKFAVVVCICCVLILILHFSDPTVLQMFSARKGSTNSRREFDLTPHRGTPLNMRLNTEPTPQNSGTSKEQTTTRSKLVTPQTLPPSGPPTTTGHPTSRPVTQLTTTTASDSIEPTDSPTETAGVVEEMGCKLPKLDPWDHSIRHLLKEEGVDPGCRTRYPLPLFDVLDNRLIPKPGVKLNEFKSISVTTIERPPNDDWSVNHAYGENPFKQSDESKSEIINRSDFFRLSYTKNDGQFFSHLYARVVPKKEIIEARKKPQQTGKTVRDLNVLILGFDSTSAANFLRYMKHSLDFLVKGDLHTHFIKGYSVIGDATTPNMCALLTGKDETEVPEARRSMPTARSIDSWPWLAKRFKGSGYATLFAEDDPTMAMFNLRLLGLNNPAGIYDHYMRPFWLELESAGERDEPGVCSKSTSMANHTLDYLTSYFQAYPDTPKFGFAFMGFATHARPNYLSFIDYDLLHFLKFLSKNNFHENTILAILGDHGSRNDDVRNTMQGKLEERLPWLSITLPKWVEEKYPDIRAALRHNQNVVSTPFDLHATLRHVLTYPDPPTGEKGQSLFTKIPHNRTCQDAHIDEHWCPCLQFQPANVNDQQIKRAAEEVVKKINKISSSNSLLKRLCKRLSLKKIHSAVKYQPNTKVQTFSNTNQDSDRGVNFGYQTPDNLHYQITLETTPGGGLFEATVTIDTDGVVVVNPFISRTNFYHDQPKCIAKKYPYARKFCLCKTQNK